MRVISVGTLAHMIAMQSLADVAIVDIAGGVAAGKALDIMQAGSVWGSDVVVEGGDDYRLLQGSDAVIVTAGAPRKAGMSRDDLVEINTKITKQVAEGIKKHAHESFVVMVTNPLDAMVWVMQQVSGIPTNNVVGMAGILDAARFCHVISRALGVSKQAIHAMVMGGHGDTMVPLVDHTTVAGVSLRQSVQLGWLSQQEMDRLIAQTRDGGAEIIGLLGSSAFYAPAISALTMVLSYLRDEKRVLPCAAWLQGQYGVDALYAGVPVVIGAGGVERVVELTLREEEKAQFEKSVKAVRDITSSAEKILARL